MLFTLGGNRNTVPQKCPLPLVVGGTGVRMGVRLGRSWTLVQGTDGGTCPPSPLVVGGTGYSIAVTPLLCL